MRHVGALSLRALLVVIILALGRASQAENTATTPVPREKDWWMARHEAILARLKQGQVDVVWVGDSIIEHWEEQGKPIWDEYYAGRNCINLGYGGDRTEHVLWRLDHGEVDGISPKLAIVMIGQNNYKSNTAEEIGEGVVAVVHKLREKLPATKILLLAIFPIGEKLDEYRARLAEASTLSSRLSDGKSIFYMDINPVFLDDDGALPAAVMPDFEHPSLQGHRMWAEAIEPMVAGLLGDHARPPSP